jgi:hypothetical protein
MSYQMTCHLRSSALVAVLAVGVALSTGATSASAKGGGLFLPRRVYTPGETIRGRVIVYDDVGRAAADRWDVIVMVPDPLWFGPRPRRAPDEQRVPASVEVANDGNDLRVSWVVPTLPPGRYTIERCPFPCGPSARRDVGVYVLIAPGHSAAPLVRRIERLLVRRVEIRHDMTPFRRTINMLRATRHTAHRIADYQARVANDLRTRLTATRSSVNDQRASMAFAGFVVGVLLALAAATLAFWAKRFRASSPRKLTVGAITTNFPKPLSAISAAERGQEPRKG